MSKASWVAVNPESGSGNKSVGVSSTTEHSGRTARTTTLTIRAAGVESRTVTVNQAGKPQHVDSQDTASASKSAGNVTISGKANSKQLTFSLGAGDLAITLPANYTANSVDTVNGAEISGDPGAALEYDWAIVIPVVANEGVSELARQIVVTDESGNSDTCLLTQAAGDATLTVSKTSIDLLYTGASVSFDITSNTNWTIS